MPRKHHKEHSDQHPPVATAKPLDNRAVALDVLRGLAILAMVLSSVVPSGQTPWGTLPPWMYHAQNPPPTHATDATIPGITWVDIVFPFFLFSMGAAIPLALGRRMEKGGWWGVVPGILWRGVLLAAFAIFREHVDPFSFSASPARIDWWIALLAFPLMFLIWWRPPKSWPLPLQWLFHLCGWILALVLLTHIRYPDNANLAWTRHALRQWVEREDIIILVLANVSVAGSIIWLFTRNSWLARLAPVGFLLALRISASAHGWASRVWDATPAPWLYRMEFMKYLMIVLPGTIVGDMLVTWLKTRHKERDKPGWHVARVTALTLLLFAFVPLLAIGLQQRWVIGTTVAAAAMLAVCTVLTLKPVSELDKLTARLFHWGAYWLTLGLIFEPYEGGIKKTETTLSYFFVTLGLAILMLAAFNLLVERLHGRWSVALLSDNGQNPLLAYYGITNLVLPLLVLTGLSAWLERALPGLWQGVFIAVLETLILAAVVSAATRMKVFVRA